MTEKIYTAFISSAFESLRDERNTVINTLLDFRILPISMEHFTVSTSGEFSDLEELIDRSDFFILLLGGKYGSTDSNGISWTEREYRYARMKKKPIVAIKCDEYVAIQNKPVEALTEEEKKQLDFGNEISFSRTATTEFSINYIMNLFLNTYDFSKCIGWTRLENTDINAEELKAWREAHKVYDLSGMWYHVHLSEDDETYIRVGTIKIEQDFSPNKYYDLHMDGENFNVSYYDTSTGQLRENRMKSSRFVGDYKLQENGEIFGIFNSRRTFSDGMFQDAKVTKGTHRGIHDFIIDVFAKETTYIEGEFHDEAPSPKHGRIFLFRNIEDRNAFILENREHIIEQK